MFAKRSRRSLPAGFRDSAEAENWLLDEVARLLNVRREELNAAQPLVSLGLDSRSAIAVAGDLEQIIGRELSPTLIWDHADVRSLIAHVMDSAASAGSE